MQATTAAMAGLTPPLLPPLCRCCSCSAVPLAHSMAAPPGAHLEFRCAVRCSHGLWFNEGGPSKPCKFLLRASAPSNPNVHQNAGHRDHVQQRSGGGMHCSVHVLVCVTMQQPSEQNAAPASAACDLAEAARIEFVPLQHKVCTAMLC